MAFTVYRSQMEAIRKSYYHDFYVKVYNQLLVDGIELDVLADKELSIEIISDFVDEAEEYEIITEMDIYKYVKLIFENEVLQERPFDDAVLEILTWPDRAAERKFKLVEKHIRT